MNDNDAIEKLIADYFQYLAQQFPVMCASDEFHFLPRSGDACDYYHELDDFDAEHLEEVIAAIGAFQQKFSSLATQANELERQIDLESLKANAAGALIELDTKRSWRYNPLIYLKTAFIGLDHALNKPGSDSYERFDRFKSRLLCLPRLLNQAIENIVSIPESFHPASINMIDDCELYLEDIRQLAPDTDSISKDIDYAADALKALKSFCLNRKPVPDASFASDTLESSLKEHFASMHSPLEIFEIAKEEWDFFSSELETLQQKFDPNKSWQDIYHDFVPPEFDTVDTFTLYSQQIDQLRTFFSRHGFHADPLQAPLEVAETPVYLRSVRGTASFAAAFSSDVQEKSFFYLTTRLPHTEGNNADVLLKKRLHREYKLLTAHETIPGHHLLDSSRRQIINPVRRQIESPLFYEGWASYVESLLAEYGYLQHPVEILIDCKRRLWRAARCMIDVGQATEMVTPDKAMALLTSCGFTAEESQRQIDRFKLNPGYQLCYCLGAYEITQLKNQYASRLGEKAFHSFILEGGELPFHLIKQRLDNTITNSK